MASVPFLVRWCIYPATVHRGGSSVAHAVLMFIGWQWAAIFTDSVLDRTRSSTAEDADFCFSAMSASQVVNIVSIAMYGETVSRETLNLLALVLLSCGGPLTSVTARTSSPLSSSQLVGAYHVVSALLESYPQ